MRTIVFRGKRVDNKEWVEGCLWEQPQRYGNHSMIYIQDGDEETEDTGWVHIDRNTLGQYINIKGYKGEFTHNAKNRQEVKLFEGDIVEAMSEGYKGTFQIYFRNEGAPSYILYPAYQNKDFWKIHGSDIGRTKGDYFDGLKVIGNIHDNPELLNR